MSDAPDSPSPRGRLPHPLAALILAMAAILLVGLSLRIPTISLSPLVPAMMDDTGHGETFVSLLTSVPLALTLLAAPIAPVLANRLGRSRTVSLSLLAIVAGTVIRSIPGEAPLLIGTGMLGFSIAIVTVLAPSIISAERTTLRSRLTGVYSMSLSLGPALALALTVPVGEFLDLEWRGTLLIWIVVSAGALVLWWFYSRTYAEGTEGTTDESVDPANEPRGSNPRGGHDPRGGHGAKAVLGDVDVWMLALFLGVTSLMFYTTSAWLPTVFVGDGMSAQVAGGFVSLINVIAIPFGLIAPALLGRGASRILAPFAPLLAVGGVVLLLIADSQTALIVTILLGVAQGLCLGVSYDQIIGYGRSPAHTASVSAVTSAVGVALAALGPFAFGLGLEVAGSAAVPLLGLALVAAAQSVIGLRTSRL
ncbi:MFS transporter [Brevibacterium sp. S111]|uniref:MFS transporter n=1 Tax=Brevibacterium sp. S111 TaxID=2483795 RepID=UPI001080A515|nr:MFS transporter [Brevibacterium sp. S111]TGD11682.1 MFS transporter [Brevibacterium sp. S111]